jgi:hypothetical protein
LTVSVKAQDEICQKDRKEYTLFSGEAGIARKSPLSTKVTLVIAAQGFRLRAKPVHRHIIKVVNLLPEKAIIH